MPPDAFDDGRGTLRIDRTQTIHEGEYECTATDPRGGDPHAPGPQGSQPPQVSQPARINVRIRK